MKKRIFVLSLLLVIFIQWSFAQQGTMELPQPVKTSIAGRLISGVHPYNPIGDGYVFALSTNRKEVFGYSKTRLGRGPDGGRFNIYNLPESGKILLVGFHPNLWINIAIQEVKLQGRYQDIGILRTSIVLASEGPGGADLGASPLGALAVFGWIAERKLAKDAYNEAASLAAQLLRYAEQTSRTVDDYLRELEEGVRAFH